MLEIINEEAKTEEEAVSKILSNLNCNREDVYLKTEFVEGKLFKGSKYIVSAIKKEEITKMIDKTITELGNLMNIKIDSEVLLKEDVYNITLVSDNNSILIGKDGKTLNSIQTIIRQAIKNKINLGIKINLDVANYKLKRMRNIEREVRTIAEEVSKSKLDASLDPMNSYERRLVHSMIDEFKNLTTESVGEGRERHVIIKYVEKA